jgi:hypothetical protein
LSERFGLFQDLQHRLFEDGQCLSSVRGRHPSRRLGYVPARAAVRLAACVPACVTAQVMVQVVVPVSFSSTVSGTVHSKVHSEVYSRSRCAETLNPKLEILNKHQAPMANGGRQARGR